MKMTMKVIFDPTAVLGKQLEEAVLKIDPNAKVTFHNARSAEPKPKPAAEPAGALS